MPESEPNALASGEQVKRFNTKALEASVCDLHSLAINVHKQSLVPSLLDGLRVAPCRDDSGASPGRFIRQGAAVDLTLDACPDWVALV